MVKKQKKSSIYNAKKSNTSNISKTKIWHAPLFHKIVLFAIAFLLYGKTYNYGYGIDDKFITNTIPSIANDFSGIVKIFKSWFAGADYRPISILSFWIERKITNNFSPQTSHAVNIFLFGLILIKVYDFIIVSRLYADRNKLMFLALLSALIFAIHPNHVSVVANIKSRDNLLSMLLGIMASIYLIKYFDCKKVFYIILFIVCIILGLLSKFDSYSFIVTPLLVISLFRNKQLTIANLKKPILITILLFIVVINIVNILQILPNAKEYIFTMGFDENPLVANDSIINRFSLGITSLFYYVKFLIIPYGYYFFWGYNQIPITGFFSTTNVFIVLLLLAIAYGCYKTFSKNKIYTFCFLFFIISISYALNIITPVAGIIMDRYNFIASLGFCIAISAIIIDLYPNTKLKLSVIIVTGIIFIIYTYFTSLRIGDWENSFTILQKDMPYLSQSVNANRMAGAAYINAALDEELNPNHDKEHTDSFINVGEKYTNQGLKIYNKVADLWELKGLCSFYRKDYQQALTYFLTAKNTDSTYLSGINYVGYAYWSLNKLDSAEYYFNYVIQRSPVFDYSANNLLNLYLYNKKDKVDSLIEAFQNKYPSNPWLNRRIEEIKNLQ